MDTTAAKFDKKRLSHTDSRHNNKEYTPQTPEREEDGWQLAAVVKPEHYYWKNSIVVADTASNRTVGQGVLKTADCCRRNALALSPRILLSQQSSTATMG
eukprot:scaffold3226_cov160-Amphora_coffeaeformis.AAC.5